MADIDLKLSLKDADQIKTLITMLGDNADDLPEKVRIALYEIFDDGPCEQSWCDIRPYIVSDDECVVLVDGISVNNVTSINKPLRRIKRAFIHHDGPTHIEVSYPATFAVISNNKTVVGW